MLEMAPKNLATQKRMSALDPLKAIGAGKANTESDRTGFGAVQSKSKHLANVCSAWIVTSFPKKAR